MLSDEVDEKPIPVEVDELDENSDDRKRERDDKSKSPSPAAKRSRPDKESESEKRDKDKKKEKRERKDKDKDKDRRRSDKDERPKKRERRERSHSEDRDRKKDRRREREKDRNGREDHRDEYLEDGEVSDVRSSQPRREPTARELERMRIIEEELKKEEVEDEDRPVWSLTKAQQEIASRTCPYLDTINRNVLDFDFEKLCSVSLSHLNVYACMVCGSYFQGRGTSTHAYTHSLNTDHRVFLNLQTLKFYCLPDNYEVIDPSLDDIKYVLKPTYTKQLIAAVDNWSRTARAYDGSSYFPGVVGLNNIKENDYENVVLHALSFVPPLRDYFLQEENYASIKRPPGDKLEFLSKRFGELVRKLWNPKAFKAHVSPHEMLQAIVLTSNKKFQFIQQGDAAEFLNFLLNTLHLALNGTTKTSSSIIYKIFRGRMRQYTRKVLPVDASEEQKVNMLETEEYKEQVKDLPFLYLALDLPPAPLYRDELMQNIIPQVPLQTLLQKFNGTSEKEYKTYNENFMKKFELLRLPEYLIITYKRFQKNQWFVEKNPTIVNFPISNVDLYECLSAETRDSHKYTTYDLIANIVHDGKPEGGKYRTQILHKGSEKWFQLEDLHVTDILPQMITLAESYIQIWRLNRSKTREERLNEEGEGEGGETESKSGTANTSTNGTPMES